MTYGVSPQSDYAARGIQFRGLETSFNAYRRGEPLGIEHGIQSALGDRRKLPRQQRCQLQQPLRAHLERGEVAAVFEVPPDFKKQEQKGD